MCPSWVMGAIMGCSYFNWLNWGPATCGCNTRNCCWATAANDRWSPWMGSGRGDAMDNDTDTAHSAVINSDRREIMLVTLYSLSRRDTRWGAGLDSMKLFAQLTSEWIGLAPLYQHFSIPFCQLTISLLYTVTGERETQCNNNNIAGIQGTRCTPRPSCVLGGQSWRAIDTSAEGGGIKYLCYGFIFSWSASSSR